MARILDFYAVRWEYEPHTFPILWNLDGDVVESFSPDFYLPDLDLLPRDDDAPPEARPQEEPQAAPAARALPGPQRQAVLRARLPGPDAQVRPARAGRRPVGQLRPGRARTAAVVVERRLASTSLPGPEPSPTAAHGVRRRRRGAPAADGPAVTAMTDAVDLHADIGEILLTEEQIQAKVRELGARISADYAGRQLTLVSVLKGSLPFMADLMRAIDMPGPDRPDGGQLVRRHRDRVVRPGADPQGPVGEHRRRGRPHRRGHHRHRA